QPLQRLRRGTVHLQGAQRTHRRHRLQRYPRAVSGSASRNWRSAKRNNIGCGALPHPHKDAAMALRLNKLAAATAVAAAFSLLATPAAAIELPRAAAVDVFDGEALDAERDRRRRGDRDRY